MKLGDTAKYDAPTMCKHGYALTTMASLRHGDESCPTCFFDTSEEPVDDIDTSRKDTPIYSGVLQYFPDAIEAVARVSKTCNEQHNPGEEMHWSRDKSRAQYDSCARHLTDRAKGHEFDTDGQRHMAKAAWRALAACQIEIENANKASISD